MLLVGLVVCFWFLIGVISFCKQPNANKLFSLICGIIIFSIMLLIAYWGFVVDQKEAKKAFDALFDIPVRPDSAP